MSSFFFGNTYLYYISLGLQGICVIHCIRTSKPVRWIWIIMLIPVIGMLTYLYFEIFSRNALKMPAVDLNAVFNPGGKIRKMEDALRFSDTFNNKVQLADAYLAAGQNERAIELYESSLTGAFSENEHVQKQLMLAYFEAQRYTDVMSIAARTKKLPQFKRSKSHIVYALALERSGKADFAETEFKAMNGNFSCFEQRFYYGEFLERQGRPEEASHVFEKILEEAPHLGAVEKRSNREWFSKARDRLKKIAV